MELIGCFETSLRNSHYSLRNNPEERSTLLGYYTRNSGNLLPKN